MTKEQINYLLVLATLFIVWLYFNTFYVHGKKIYGGSPLSQMVSGPSVKFPNLPEIPKMPDLKNTVAAMPQVNRIMAGPRNTVSTPAETSTIPLPPMPTPEKKQ